MNRESLKLAPARVVDGSASFFSKDVIKVDLGFETFEVATDGHGKLEERISDFICKASFTPDGRITAAVLAVLHPYTNTTIGTRLFSNTDRPIQFHTKDSDLHTIITGAVTKCPSIKFSAKETLWGPVEYTGLRGNNMDPDDNNSLFTTATNGGTFTDSGFAASGIKTQPYTGAWSGISGLTTIHTENGFQFDVDIKLVAKPIDGHGTFNLYFQSIAAMVKFVPIEATAAELLSALNVQGSGVAIGAAAGASAAFTITGADSVVYLTIPSAGLKTAGFRYGSLELQNGEMGMFAKRTFSAGAQVALYTLAAS